MPRNEKPLSELKQELERFAGFEKENLIKRTEWGTINLEEAKPDFDKIYDIINYLNILPLDILTVNAINAIKGAVKQVNDNFEQINQFSIESANPADQRNNFVTQIQNQADALYTQASPWIPFLAYQKGDVSQNIESLTKSVQEAGTLIESAKNSISEKEKEIQDIITKAREASAAAGAAIFTKDFQRESDSAKDNAKKWLWGTAILGALTLIAAIAMWYFVEPALDKGQLWQKLGTKLAILGILISGTFWCGKIYKALMHQATINRHRALGIQTLQAFSAAVEDISMKDAVVLEAARAVFGNVSTGYIDNPSSSESDIKIFEVAKNLLPK
jgi:cation transport ATPase